MWWAGFEQSLTSCYWPAITQTSGQSSLWSQDSVKNAFQIRSADLICNTKLWLKMWFLHAWSFGIKPIFVQCSKWAEKDCTIVPPPSVLWSCHVTVGGKREPACTGRRQHHNLQPWQDGTWQIWGWVLGLRKISPFRGIAPDQGESATTKWGLLFML